VADIGYTHIEFGKFYGESAASFKKFLNAAGLKALAGGTSISEMKKEEQFKKRLRKLCTWGRNT
jgi:hypothetical protein